MNIPTVLGKVTRDQAKSVMLHLMNQLSYAKLKPVLPDCKTVITRARSSGYLLKNCKLYAHNAAHGRTSPAAFDVQEGDAPLLRSLELRYRFECQPLTIKELDGAISGILSSREMRDHVGKLVFKKMKFLRSYGHDLEDIRFNLLERANYVLLKQYPLFKSDLHMTNVAKTAIHNEAMDFIKAQTRQKRQSLTPNGDGTFNSLIVPIHLMQEPIAITPDDFIRDSLMSIASLEATFKPRTKRFLSVMAGQYDQEFSEFLGRPNDDFIETADYERYRTLLEEFLSVSRQQTDELFAFIRKNGG